MTRQPRRALGRVAAQYERNVTLVPAAVTSATTQAEMDCHPDLGNDYQPDGADLPIPKQIINPLQYLLPLLFSDVGSRDHFEREFNSFLGGQVRVFSLGKARAGLYLLVKAAVKRHRKQVILSPYTIPDILNMIIFAGGRPVFVDNLPLSTNVDVWHLSKLINPSVACVLITHYHVNQNELSDIRNLCRSKDIPLFDDCALSVGAQHEGVQIGCCTDASVFSMSGFKPLNYFLGGAITTASAEIADAIYPEISRWPELRNAQYATAMIRTALYDFATRPPFFARVTFSILRRKAMQLTDAELLPPTRMDSKTLDQSLLTRPSKAAMWELRRKLPFVGPQLERRKAIAAIYDKVLGDRFISNDSRSHTRHGSSFVHYPIFVDPEYRNDVYRTVLSRGYHVGLSAYPNIHEMRVFKDIPGRSRNVSNLVRSALTLPTHLRITEGHAWRLAYAVRDAIRTE